MKISKENGFEYKFRNIPDLRCSMSGDFNYKDTPIKKQWRPGQVFIKIDNKRIGTKSLRKQAYKAEIENIPF